MTGAAIVPCGARYLLQGLVTCRRCKYAYYGKPVSIRSAKGKARAYAYYRCVGTDAYRFGGQRVCSNLQLRTDMLDGAVWSEVRTLLSNPGRLEEEYRRRLRPTTARGDERDRLDAQVAKLKKGIARMIDSYAEGFIEKSEFEPRIKQARERSAKLEEQLKRLSDQAALTSELRLVIGKLEEFAVQVSKGLDDADWSTRRELIRTLVKRVEVDEKEVNVVFRVG